MGLERKSFCSRLVILVDPRGSFGTVIFGYSGGGIVWLLEGKYGHRTTFSQCVRNVRYARPTPR